MKFLPVGAELFHADRRVNMAKLKVDFHNFTKEDNPVCVSRTAPNF